MRVGTFAILFGSVLIGCSRGAATLPVITTEALARLPEPTTNNAVASVEVPSGTFLLTFMGLGSGKGFADVHSRARFSGPGIDGWEKLPDVPGNAGRLASVAATLRGRIHLFGGYTVAADGTERSTPEVWAFDVGSGRYVERAAMPVAVDDAVALVYRNRYVYLVGGWSNDGNVDDVQMYDTIEDAWRAATPWPGTPVFGHAGGIVGDRIVVCDGVEVVKEPDGSRRFATSDECWAGDIAADDLTQIAWRRIDPHPGRPRYRVAATGDEALQRYIFAGGSEVAYNFDGVGYDGRLAEPAEVILTLDAATLRWQEMGRLDVPSMDHRGLLIDGDRFVIVGGMRRGREVVNDVVAFRIPLVRP